MLVLSRKLDEEIFLGSDISIKVIDINKGVVKLGIEAPKSMQILRGELKKDVEDANKTATNPTLNNIKDLSNLLKK